MGQSFFSKLLVILSLVTINLLGYPTPENLQANLLLSTETLLVEILERDDPESFEALVEEMTQIRAVIKANEIIKIEEVNITTGEYNEKVTSN